jgi:nucleotide-binding universal stress UspA family protein
LASLRALREAVDEARRRAAPLTVVHVRPPAHLDPSVGVAGVVPYPASWPSQPVGDDALDQEAGALISRCLEEGLGGVPRDVEVSSDVAVGRPHTALVKQVWRDDDLLVVGTRSRGRWAHPWRRSVSRYCAAHAVCPVLLVPPDSFARAARRESRWYRPLLGRNPWKRFETELQENRLRVAGGRTPDGRTRH